jgi:Domain of unknown function (DUF4412)
MRRLLYCLTVLGALCCIAMPAQGQGILFVQKETRGSQTETSQIQMDKDHIRVESRSSGEETAFVFDGPKQTARMINITKKTYMEMTKADLDQMRGQVDAAMAQMQEQLRNLPPEQRAMVEQMMRGRGLPNAGPANAASAAPKATYRQTGSDKVANWACNKYEGSVNGQKTTEVCTVDPKEFGLTPADFEAARQLAEFMKSMLPQMPDSAFVNGTTQAEGFSGVPVRRTSFRNGTVDSVTEITEARRQAFPAATFEVPAGFRKESMPGARR